METLERILEACRTEADNTHNVINKMIADSEDEGIDWPELEEEDEPEHGICPKCAGTGCYSCRHTGEF